MAWTEDEAKLLIGSALTASAKVMQDAGVELSTDDIIGRFTASVKVQVTQDVLWRPGARELLAELHQMGIAFVLVTMSHPMTNAVGHINNPVLVSAAVARPSYIRGMRKAESCKRCDRLSKQLWLSVGNSTEPSKEQKYKSGSGQYPVQNTCGQQEDHQYENHDAVDKGEPEPS